MSSSSHKTTVSLIMTISSLDDGTYSSKWTLCHEETSETIASNFGSPRDARIWALQNGYIFSDNKKEYVKTKFSAIPTILSSDKEDRISSPRLLIIKKEL